MAKKKVYAVKKGKQTGIFYSWDACKASVEGFPSAEYRGFSYEEEAREYLSGTSGEKPSFFKQEQAEKGTKEKGVQEQVIPDRLTAYVDGSFDESIGKYSFGCVLLTPEGEIIRESGNGDNPESLALRNVTGEMLGAMFAVKWCELNGYSEIQICYDYSGIEMWATGGWRAKNDLTQKYAAFMQEQSKKIKISFHKIAAHTGNQYNEEADKLAKEALINGNGIPKIKR